MREDGKNCKCVKFKCIHQGTPLPTSSFHSTKVAMKQRLPPCFEWPLEDQFFFFLSYTTREHPFPPHGGDDEAKTASRGPVLSHWYGLTGENHPPPPPPAHLLPKKHGSILCLPLSRQTLYRQATKAVMKERLPPRPESAEAGWT